MRIFENERQLLEEWNTRIHDGDLSKPSLQKVDLAPLNPGQMKFYFRIFFGISLKNVIFMQSLKPRGMSAESAAEVLKKVDIRGKFLP